jgi:hypothetical protein
MIAEPELEGNGSAQRMELAGLEPATSQTTSHPRGAGLPGQERRQARRDLLTMLFGTERRARLAKSSSSTLLTDLRERTFTPLMCRWLRSCSDTGQAEGSSPPT